MATEEKVVVTLDNFEQRLLVNGLVVVKHFCNTYG